MKFEIMSLAFVLLAFSFFLLGKMDKAIYCMLVAIWALVSS